MGNVSGNEAWSWCKGPLGKLTKAKDALDTVKKDIFWSTWAVHPNFGRWAKKSMDVERALAALAQVDTVEKELIKMEKPLTTIQSMHIAVSAGDDGE